MSSELRVCITVKARMSAVSILPNLIRAKYFHSLVEVFHEVQAVAESSIAKNAFVHFGFYIPTPGRLALWCDFVLGDNRRMYISC